MWKRGQQSMSLLPNKLRMLDVKGENEKKRKKKKPVSISLVYGQSYENFQGISAH